MRCDRTPAPQYAGAAAQHDHLAPADGRGRVVICNLAKGQLGEGTSHLFGALLTTTIAQAALSRADLSPTDRRSFHLYADEFQSFATDSFALILSEARKYGLTLTVAHQYLDQLPDQLRAAVFGNVGSMLACRTGASDTPIIAEQTGVGGAEALLDLPNHTAWARLLAGGVPTSPLCGSTFMALRSPADQTRRKALCADGAPHSPPQVELYGRAHERDQLGCPAGP